MDNETAIRLLFILLAGQTTLIVGVYVWSFKLSQGTDVKLAKIYDCIDKNCVKKEVFELAYTNQSEDIAEIKGDVKVLIEHQIKKAG
jgi:hypothetical protein